MTLDADEFIRRFLLHSLPDGFHRIRHYGFFANGHRAGKLVLCRKLLTVASPTEPPAVVRDQRDHHRRQTAIPLHLCPGCGEVMVTLDTLAPSARCHPSFWNSS
jgi:hypothetical protein